jgi:hypothetical protein
MKARKGLYWATAIALAVSAGWFMSQSSETIAKARSLDREERLAQAAGVPTRAEDLRLSSPLRASHNAAIELKQAAEILKRSLTVRAALNKNDADLLEEALADEPELLPLLYAAGEKPLCDFDEDFNADAYLASLSQIRAMGQILTLHALSAAEKGDSEAVRKSLDAASQLAGHAGAEPMIVAALAAARIDEMLSNTILQIRTEHKGDLAMLAVLHSATEERSNLPTPRHALGGEVIASLADYHVDGDPAELNNSERARRATIIRAWRRAYESLDTQASVTGLLDAIGSQDLDDPLFGSVRNIITFSVPKVIGILEARSLDRELVRATVEAEKYFAAHGSYPESLEELGIPASSALNYARHKDGFTISYAPDLMSPMARNDLFAQSPEALASGI